MTTSYRRALDLANHIAEIEESPQELVKQLHQLGLLSTDIIAEDIKTAVNSTASEKLIELRGKAGYSRQRIVDLLGKLGFDVHETSVRRMETGEQRIKFDEAVALARIFDIDITEFAGTVA